jgi:formylglycine-generating enzyme required for sulfatase activity
VYPSAVRAVALLLLLAAVSADAFEASSGRAAVARRPLESMITIRPGQFLMGASTEMQAAALDLCREEIGARHRLSCVREIVESEGPQRRVYLSGFSIDRVTVTVGAYRNCVQAGACSATPLTVSDERFLGATMPITSVTFSEAATYCAWRGGRLPSEAEWERAARGTDGRVWPWGNVLKPGVFNHGRFAGADDVGGDYFALIRPDASDGTTFVAPVGSHPDGLSPEGVFDMAGNVMQWTSDFYAADAPQKSSAVNPHGPEVANMHVLRGGSWRQPPFFARTTYRESATPDTRSPEIGFRCAR